MVEDEAYHLRQVVALLCDALKRLETAVTSGNEADLIHYTNQCAERRRHAQNVILDELCPKTENRK